jgi:hypothetical protein
MFEMQFRGPAKSTWQPPLLVLDAHHVLGFLFADIVIVQDAAQHTILSACSFAGLPSQGSANHTRL